MDIEAFDTIQAVKEQLHGLAAIASFGEGFSVSASGLSVTFTELARRLDEALRALEGPQQAGGSLRQTPKTGAGGRQ